MVKKLKFRIDDKGEVYLDVEGTVGAECDALSAPFESSLGVLATKERKDTFFQVEELGEIRQGTQ